MRPALELLANPAPVYLVDSKTRRFLNDVTQQWKFQSIPMSCYPTCIHNILTELAQRNGTPEILLSEKRVNDLCRFKPYSGPQCEVVVQNINSVIRQNGYRAYESSRSSHDLLRKILEDETCSYPIVGFSYKYLETELQVAYPPKARENPDHVVTMLMDDGASSAFFDPYLTIRHNPRVVQQSQGRGVMILPTGRVTDDYWNGASDPSWMFWIQWDRSKSTRLETFIGGSETASRKQ
jgi:hypothetical protein